MYACAQMYTYTRTHICIVILISPTTKIKTHPHLISEGSLFHLFEGYSSRNEYMYIYIYMYTYKYTRYTIDYTL